ncbi:PilZ domain-containing protein [Pseudidiomarina planktonica]|uniref:PilZ domain-containing protein n=2 Tax=Pseudidiomarina planktonica TaxID=1323738 RepID=A0A1Y6EZ32_9GAMM|nr:flagellar brake protein [Pseudidiomarina planktonica]SMQ65772.1 PilZ domain-containing protein [Pseudidiomarina planktonica]
MDMLKKIFELPVGQRVEIQINKTSVPLRFQTEFVGIVKKRFFIVAMPDTRKFGDMRDAIYEGVAVVVRFVLEGDLGEVIAFRSDVEFITSHPTKLMYIDMPQIVESRPIRSDRRFETRLPTQITKMAGADSDYSALVVNLSMSGCQLVVQDEALDVEKDSHIDLRFQWLQQDITITGIVRDIRVVHRDDESPQTMMGIQFARSRNNEDIKQLFAASLIDIDSADY